MNTLAASQIDSMASSIEKILKSQNSLVSEYSHEIVGCNLYENTVDIKVRAVPAAYTSGMEVNFSCTSNDKTVETKAVESSAKVFESEFTVPLSDEIIIYISLYDGEKSKNQLIEAIYGEQSRTLFGGYASENISLASFSVTDIKKRKEEIELTLPLYEEMLSYCKEDIFIEKVKFLIFINEEKVREYDGQWVDNAMFGHGGYVGKFTADFELKDGDIIYYVTEIKDNYGRIYDTVFASYIVKNSKIENYGILSDKSNKEIIMAK